MYKFFLDRLFGVVPLVVQTAPTRSIPTQASISSIQWTSCGPNAPSNLDCGQFIVPMDWSNPSGETVQLGMNRIRVSSNSTRLGNLIFNPGGPGGSATEVCDAVAAGLPLFSEALASHYDIICPDPRGIGISNPIRCDPNLWNSRQTLFPQDNVTYHQMVDHYRAFGESCLKLTGDLVKYVDTVSVAKDFEAIRVALNDSKLNYMGMSYGSQLGATYANLFPQSVGTMILDGILDHSASETYWTITESETYEHVLDSFFDWCHETKTCPLYGQDVSQIFDDLVRQADDTPISAPNCSTSIPNPITGGPCFPNVTGEDIRFNAQGLLSMKNGSRISNQSWNLLSEALSEAQSGNATRFSSPAASGENSTIWQGLAVLCLDWTRNQNSADNQYKQLLGASISPHTRGAAYSYTVETLCAGWPVPATNLQRLLNQTAMALAPPIMLVNSYYDPATSYTWAVSVKEQVPNGVLLTRNGYGHTSYLLGGEATALMDAFLVNGTMPAPDTVVQS